MSEILSSGKTPLLADLGGLDALIEGANEISVSPLMPTFLDALLREKGNASIESFQPYYILITSMLKGATQDSVLIEVIDSLDSYRPFIAQVEDEIFMLLLQKANKSSSLSGYARALSLEGAFRWAIQNRRYQLRLLDFLLGIDSTEDPVFLAHASKIIGISYSYWHEKDLICALQKFAEVDQAEYEASFELGMAYLANALDEPNHIEANSSLWNSFAWFKKAEASRETTPEASLYADSIELLIAFNESKSIQELDVIGRRIHQCSFEIQAWYTTSSAPEWLGIRHFQTACWNDLVCTLDSLSKRLSEASWWEPAVVIEQQVLAAYNAGRVILKRDKDGFLESLIRPRIKNSIASREGQAHLVKHWLMHNQDHKQSLDAKTLLASIEEIMLQDPGPRSHPLDAALVWAPVAAALLKAQCSEEIQKKIGDLIANAFVYSLDNLTESEISIYTHCLDSVENHEDYKNNPRSTRLFGTILLWTVRFLKNRLDLTQKDDPSVSYLFEREDGSIPTESDLQADYFRWLCTQSASGEIEASNIGGGRADVVLKETGERIVIEIKREEADSSFEALASAYAAQSTDYQNTSIRFGFLLVLDLTTTNSEGTPHIRSLVHTQDVKRTKEDFIRKLVIVKVPGRRMRPSDLTQLARTNSRKSTKVSKSTKE